MASGTMTAATARPARTSGNKQSRRYAGSQTRMGSSRCAMEVGLVTLNLGRPSGQELPLPTAQCSISMPAEARRGPHEQHAQFPVSRAANIPEIDRTLNAPFIPCPIMLERIGTYVLARPAA